jgi:hypothetical protein
MKNAFPTAFAVLLLSCSMLPFAIAQTGTTKVPEAKQDVKRDSASWKTLIANESMEGWEKTNFGGEGDVDVKDGVMRIGRGDPLTGVTTNRKDFPTQDYEMQWKANRVEGSDFFVGLTFPVGKEFCSLIVGGWGGSLVGLSSINGSDASENETSSFQDIKNGKDYSFRLRVDSTHITVWMEDKELIKVERAEGKFSLRSEVFKSRPLGYCTFQSTVELKNWEYRRLNDAK